MSDFWHAVRDRGSDSGSLRGIRAYAPDCQLPLWRQIVGSDRICNCPGYFNCGRAAGGLAAGHARLQARSDGGVAGRVMP
jgi:hypothetical protein